jgi:hypothetical protein
MPSQSGEAPFGLQASRSTAPIAADEAFATRRDLAPATGTVQDLPARRDTPGRRIV